MSNARAAPSSRATDPCGTLPHETVAFARPAWQRTLSLGAGLIGVSVDDIRSRRGQ
jgi:hypothetical protein